METPYISLEYSIRISFYPTYKEWKQVIVVYYVDFNWLFILPIRNGNIFETTFQIYSAFLFILPMRNGNLSSNFLAAPNIASFYPTYEEWELIIRNTSGISVFFPFYPTYEEWKLF
nr:hypothetical protein [Petrotoga halophila]